MKKPTLKEKSRQAFEGQGTGMTDNNFVLVLVLSEAACPP
jgi:hypothetical protein